MTKYMKPGLNDVEVAIIDTLKNSLRSHHGNPSVGTAWPAMFCNGPGNGLAAGTQYNAVNYGSQNGLACNQWVDSSGGLSISRRAPRGKV